MPFRSNHTFETHSYGRSASDQGWERLEPEHIAIWESALTLLNTRKLTLTDCVVKIEADWTSILKKHKRHYATMKRIHEGFKDDKEFISAAKGFPTRKAKVKLIAEIVGGKKGSRDSAINLASGAVESYLHDCFLILNICAPGCCDFYRGTLLTIDQTTEVSLSNVHFEFALLGSFNNEWPKIRTLSLAQTIRWFDSVRAGVDQLPQSPMEKALFALLHISKLDITPMIVIWLFYAFESLLQTKAGENFASLVQRIISLLELDQGQSKTLRGKFRSLYNIRSAIVHGGFEVIHPMHDERLDKRVDENYERINDATGYGLTVLIAAVQSTILRDWKYPNFMETMYGIPIEG